MHSWKRAKFVSLILVALLLLGSMAGAGMSQRRNPEAGKKKAAKRVGIGTAIGAGAGALIGGRKGALIGAGAGAAGGTAYHYHKKRKWRKRHRRY
ncbi:MAG: YMGG-like glycine zipper-containing protein [Pyrinomonadaceae bacterium]